MATNSGPSARQPRGFWGQATRPIVAVGRYTYRSANPKAIAAGANDIRFLWALIRQKRPEAMRIVTAENGAFDVAATAKLHKVPVHEVERRLAVSLWQSGWTARVCLATALGALGGWIALAISGAGLGGTLSALLTILLLTVLVLKAGEHAQRNWQIRRRRMGTMREFLATDDTWWPTCPPRPDAR